MPSHSSSGRLNAVAFIVRRKSALTLVVRKAHAVAGIVRTPQAVTLVIWKKYTPDTCRLEDICLDTLHLEGICPDTHRLEGICHGVHHPDATCLTVVDTKKRHRFDNSRLEGYCCAHLRLVCIRMANTRWQRHVHWQAESGSIYGGTRSVTNLARQAPWRRRRCHAHPCRPVACPRFRCRSRGHRLRLGASTNLRHIARVAISPTAGRSRPLSFVSVMLLTRPFSCPLRL